MRKSSYLCTQITNNIEKRVKTTYFFHFIWQNAKKVVPLHPFSGMRGSKRAPHFFIRYIRMITKETIKTLVEEWLEQGDYFLVDIQMEADDRMNRGITDMMTVNTQELSIQAPTIWKRLSDMLPQAKESGQDASAEVRELYQKKYIPNMDADDALETMQALVNDKEPDEQQQKERDELFDALVYLGENIGKIILTV